MNWSARHTTHVFSATNIKGIHAVMFFAVCGCVGCIPSTKLTRVNISLFCIGIICATLITFFIFAAREKNKCDNDKKYSFHKSKIVKNN